MSCPDCARNLHEECSNWDFTSESCCCFNQVTVPQASFSEEPKRSRKVEVPLGVRDVSASAGRKEAAKLYPINPEEPCEWQGLANAGGGLHPIVGCATGRQRHIHHGPVKNTTENARHNIHLICHTCHNRWHGINDPVYNEEIYRGLPHKPRVATAEELTLSHAKTRNTRGSKTPSGSGSNSLGASEGVTAS